MMLQYYKLYIVQLYECVRDLTYFTVQYFESYKVKTQHFVKTFLDTTVRLAAYVTENFSRLSLYKHFVSADVNFKMHLRVQFARLSFPSNLTFTKIECYCKVAAVHATNAYGEIEL